MGARAAAAEATRRRILDAAMGLFAERFYDEVTLDEVARRAGVTAQTVIRHFGSKEGLVDAGIADLTPVVSAQRAEAPVGDVAGAVSNLFDHYEEWGDLVLRVLAQEERVPPFRRVTGSGRRVHREWVERTFAPFLAARKTPGRRLAQLATLTDVYVWKLLRRDHGLERKEAERALAEMIQALIGA